MNDIAPVHVPETPTTMVRAYVPDLPALDAFLAKLRVEQPKATRADAIRRLLEIATRNAPE